MAEKKLDSGKLSEIGNYYFKIGSDNTGYRLTIFVDEEIIEVMHGFFSNGSEKFIKEPSPATLMKLKLVI